MSKHDPRVTLQQLRDAMEQAAEIGAGQTPATLRADWKLMLALERCFEIIGEAIKRLPMALRDSYPQVEWRKAAGLRDLVSHDYDRIAHQILLDVIASHFPVMKSTINRMLCDLGGEIIPEEQPPTA